MATPVVGKKFKFTSPANEFRGCTVKEVKGRKVRGKTSDGDQTPWVTIDRGKPVPKVSEKFDYTRPKQVVTMVVTKVTNSTVEGKEPNGASTTLVRKHVTGCEAA